MITAHTPSYWWEDSVLRFKKNSGDVSHVNVHFIWQLGDLTSWKSHPSKRQTCIGMWMTTKITNQRVSLPRQGSPNSHWKSCVPVMKEMGWCSRTRRVSVWFGKLTLLSGCSLWFRSEHTSHWFQPRHPIIVLTTGSLAGPALFGATSSTAVIGWRWTPGSA